MDKLSRWLGAPGSLLVLFGTVVALPAATLVFLGVQLLQQDRALAGQRHAEILQDASDRAVRALDADLTALTRRLSDPSWRPTAAPPGAAQVLISRDETLAVPPEALAYYPVAATMKEPPAALFAGLEAAEFKAQDLPLGLDTSRRLAASADPSVQAGARQREARILRKMGRPTEALSVYRTLAAFTTISIDGEPADLFARRARCLLLEEQSRAADLRQESAALAADLDSGRWRLDRENYEYVSGQLDEWSRPTRPRRLEREAMAAAVEWLHRQWITTPGAGAAGHATGPGELAAAGARALALAAGQPPVTVVWTSGMGRVAAFVAGPQHLRTRWSEVARKAAVPAQVSLVTTASARPSRPAPAADVLAARRGAAETGLPWTIEVTLAANYDSARLESRRRMVFSGLAAVLVLVAAGSYLVVRSRQQEIALARLQSDFVAAVSHEFRTPLTALRQFNELLGEAGDLAPGKLQAYHQAQTRATDRLHRLVESLLDFGRMEAGKRPYQFESLDAGPFVRDLADDFRREIDGRGFELRCHIEPGDYPIQADPEALGRAIWNLLDNAVKYSGDGRQIDVNVGSGAGRTVSIAVRDYGIGIPKGDETRILKKFVRGAAATSAHIKGTGIGLTMTRHIVRAHRGTLRVASVEHQGSTFTIVLPIADVQVRT